MVLLLVLTAMTALLLEVCAPVRSPAQPSTPSHTCIRHSAAKPPSPGQPPPASRRSGFSLGGRAQRMRVNTAGISRHRPWRPLNTSFVYGRRTTGILGAGGEGGDDAGGAAAARHAAGGAAARGERQTAPDSNTRRGRAGCTAPPTLPPNPKNVCGLSLFSVREHAPLHVGLV